MIFSSQILNFLKLPKNPSFKNTEFWAQIYKIFKPQETWETLEIFTI